MTEPLLEVRDLKVYFPVFSGFLQRLIGGGDVRVHAVDGVTFSIAEGEVFGLVVRTRSVAYGTAAVVRLDPSQAHVGAMPG